HEDGGVGGRGGDLAKEGVGASGVGGLDGAGGGEVGGTGEAGDERLPGRVHRHPSGLIIDGAAQVGAVNQGGAGGGPLRHEAVEAAAAGGLDWGGGREVCGGGVAGEVGVAGRVHRHPAGLIVAGAAQVGGVNQGVAGGVHLGHEGVKGPTPVGGLEG